MVAGLIAWKNYLYITLPVGHFRLPGIPPLISAKPAIASTYTTTMNLSQSMTIHRHWHLRRCLTTN
jgi:hypothetical protein